MTGDEARDFVEELAKWDHETSGRVLEEFIQEAKNLVNPPRIPRIVFLHRNNTVASIDVEGQPIPELSGPFHKVRERILELRDEQTVFHGWTP